MNIPYTIGIVPLFLLSRHRGTSRLLFIGGTIGRRRNSPFSCNEENLLNNEHSIALKRLNPAWSGSLYYLFTFLSNGSYAPFIYVYFSELGLNGKQIGILSVLSPILTMLLSPMISSYVDRSHLRVKMLRISLFCVAVLVYLLQFPTTFEEIALFMVFMAIFSSPVMSIAEALIARMAQRDQLNYGGMRLWGSFGFAISALGFGAIWQVWGFKPMFIIGSLLYLPVLILAGQLQEGPQFVHAQRKPALQMLTDHGLLLLLIATFFASVSNSLAMTYNGVYARSLGSGNLLIGMITAFGAFAELPIMFYSDRIAFRLKKVNGVLLAYLLMALAFVGYVLVKNPVWLPLFSAVRGLGYGLWITITIRLVTHRTPAEWAATAQSLLTVCMFGMAPLVAGLFGGWIYDAISPAAVFILGIIALGSAITFLGWGSRRYEYQ